MRRREGGFTFLEFLVIAGILAILAVLAFPNLIRTYAKAQESGVRDALRAFHAANASFRSKQDPPAYASDMEVLIDSTPSYLDASWKQTPRQGYHFRYIVRSDPKESYSLLAVPQEGAPHKSVYCIDQSGILSGGAQDVTGSDEGCRGGSSVVD